MEETTSTEDPAVSVHEDDHKRTLLCLSTRTSSTTMSSSQSQQPLEHSSRVKVIGLSDSVRDLDLDVMFEKFLGKNAVVHSNLRPTADGVGQVGFIEFDSSTTANAAMEKAADVTAKQRLEHEGRPLRLEKAAPAYPAKGKFKGASTAGKGGGRRLYGFSQKFQFVSVLLLPLRLGEKDPRTARGRDFVFRGIVRTIISRPIRWR